MSDNNQEYIYGEIALDNAEQVVIAQHVNTFLLDDDFIDEPMTKPDEVIGLSMRSIVNLVERVGVKVYDPIINEAAANLEEATKTINQMREKIAEDNKRIEATELVYVEINNKLTEAQLTITSMSQQLAQFQSEERNNLQH